MSERLVVLSTVAGPDDAERIANELVARRVAACVNVVPGIVSVYRYKGKLERDAECLLVIKTRRERFAALQDALLTLHPYDVPEILALPVESGSAAYLQWLDDAVGDQEGVEDPTG